MLSTKKTKKKPDSSQDKTSIPNERRKELHGAGKAACALACH